jgi:hypothetical protein
MLLLDCCVFWPHGLCAVAAGVLRGRQECGLVGRHLPLDCASFGHTETVRAFEACGADVSAADHRGRTPVWVSAESGHTACVWSLVEGGADASAADDAGSTPVGVTA